MSLFVSNTLSCLPTITEQWWKTGMFHCFLRFFETGIIRYTFLNLIITIIKFRTKKSEHFNSNIGNLIR